MTLKVFILGNGGAAKKHRAAFAELPDLYEVTDDRTTANIIDICSPNFVHFDIARLCLEAGRHVIVEKPVAGSLAEVDALLELEVTAGKRVCPIAQYRFTAGDPIEPFTHIESYWRRDVSYYEGWRGDWETALGGCLVSHGIHVLDLALTCFGIPTSVSARLQHSGGVDTGFDIVIDWPTALQMISLRISPHETQGGFELGDPHRGYVNQFQLFHDTLTIGTRPPVKLKEARDAIEVITACYWSALTLAPVTLPLTPEHPFYRGWTQHFVQQSLPSQAYR